MLRDAVRGVVVVAAELAEEAGRRALGAAEGLLARGGVDVAELERRLGGPFPTSPEELRTLAGEAVTAGRAGIDLVTGVARSEVERVFEKVGDQVVKVGVVLSFLESKLREVEEEQPAPAKPESRAGGLFQAGWEAEAPAYESEPGNGWDAEEWAEPEPEDVPSAAPAAPRKAMPRKPAAGKSTAKKAAAQGSAAGSAAKKSTAKKAAAKKATGTSAAAKKAAAKKTASAGTAKKAAARKVAVKKTAAAGTARKTSAKKTTVVRRSSSAKESGSDG
ncbi:hypothetical protein ACGFX4_36650 [Kitasatospora sp. NPDC048365]|uniref:hypothetical protein n=1 Tax=Kitasatospora sp. NPDC048365 TaxID=3364050 RepID=UPI00371A4203